MSINVAVAGAGGRMSQALIDAIAADPELKLVGASEHISSSLIGTTIAPGVSVCDSAASAAARADVWLDFTRPAATRVALEQIRLTPVKTVIIGTTGLIDADEEAIAAAARTFTIVKSGNFSLGVNLLAALVEDAAKRLGPEWDIEILETHHNRKVDAPSGTANLLGDAAAKGRSKKLSQVRRDNPLGARTRGSIGFAARRAGGIFGEHEVMFASENETIRLSHTALNRTLFADGAMAAVRWAHGKAPGLYSMRDVLGL